MDWKSCIAANCAVSMLYFIFPLSLVSDLPSAVIVAYTVATVYSTKVSL